MRVQILALSQGGASHLWRAGRPWPTDAALEVEVLDQDADPPPISVKVPNSTTGKMMDETRPDPLRIGRASYAAVKADKRLRIIETGDVNSAAADAAVQAARAEVLRLSGELADERVARARAEADVERLTKELERLTKELDEATKPPAVKTTATQIAPTPEAKPAKPGKPSASAPNASDTVVSPVSAGASGIPLPGPTIPAGAPAPAAATGDAPKETPPAA